MGSYVMRASVETGVYRYPLKRSGIREAEQLQVGHLEPIRLFEQDPLNSPVGELGLQCESSAGSG